MNRYMYTGLMCLLIIYQNTTLFLSQTKASPRSGLARNLLRLVNFQGDTSFQGDTRDSQKRLTSPEPA